MTVIDPGHWHELSVLDGGPPMELIYVKRVGEKYPGNADAHPGTTLQEVLRSALERIVFLDGQEHDRHRDENVWMLERVVRNLEARAAERHGRTQPTVEEAVHGRTCPGCLHVGCGGRCGAICL